jgi:PEP-CTERM motif
MTTITSLPQPFPVGDMHFQVWTSGGGSIEITRGASDVGAVPEPSTWAMMILGFAGVGFMAYRRRKVAALAA